MLHINTYLRKQLSDAYATAQKAITSGDAEREYIKLAKEGSQSAKDMLFNLYIPMVITYARSAQYEMYSGELGDFMSAAAIGFNRALELFDVTSGNEFGCYYKWHLKNALNKEMYGDCVVHVPENLLKPGKDENGKVLRDEDGKPIKKNPVKIISGDTIVGDDDSKTTLFETLSADCVRGIAEAECVDGSVEAEERDTGRVIDELLGALPAIECDAVKNMIMDDNHVSTRDWGESHGCSHEWARKVKNKALKRLRSKLSEMYIEDRLAV